VSKQSIHRIAAVGATGAIAAAAIAAGAVATQALASGAPRHEEHVLLLSVDGMHQSDLAWYAKRYPHSALAALVAGGTEYTNAKTTVPSDSFPGMVAQVTGGDPGVTGVYYDDTYNHALDPAGTTNCKLATAGAEVDYTEDLDLNKSSIDAGQGLANLPGSILGMTGNPTVLINASKLPVDPKTCKPVYPYQYLKVNTIFQIAHSKGLLTAWSDKHPAYDILAGKNGTGIDDLFTPEINSTAIGYASGNDWTTDNAATEQYDNYKVEAVLNEIDGYNHSRTAKAGTPAIFGMNFQTVSTAQKLPSSDSLTGGYLANGTPGPLLQRALGFINTEAGRMISEIKSGGLADSTEIILSAKHGQSPVAGSSLTRIDDSTIIAGLDAAWAKLHPKAAALVAFSTDDDVMQLWLSNRSQAAADFARQYLLSHSATGNTITGASRTLAASGLKTVYAGAASAKYFGIAVSDARHPDVFGIVQHGVVYTGGTAKIAEHGGADADDRDVPLVVTKVSAIGSRDGSAVSTPVFTKQIAPTILKLLGINPRELDAVRIEGTKVLSRQ
jgi:hypothetical protein